MSLQPCLPLQLQPSFPQVPFCWDWLDPLEIFYWGTPLYSIYDQGLYISHVWQYSSSTTLYYQDDSVLAPDFIFVEAFCQPKESFVSCDSILAGAGGFVLLMWSNFFRTPSSLATPSYNQFPSHPNRINSIQRTNSTKDSNRSTSFNKTTPSYPDFSSFERFYICKKFYPWQGIQLDTGLQFK